MEHQVKACCVILGRKCQHCVAQTRFHVDIVSAHLGLHRGMPLELALLGLLDALLLGFPVFLRVEVDALKLACRAVLAIDAVPLPELVLYSWQQHTTVMIGFDWASPIAKFFDFKERTVISSCLTAPLCIALIFT